tara:strand:+ start:454 stop:861 length:408 start_codon:yes stop_codon:yes gene_type:complete
MKLLFVILLMSLVVACTSSFNVQNEKPTAAFPSVTLYSTSWCSWCTKAKKFLKERGVPYVEKDFDNYQIREELFKLAETLGYDPAKLNGVPIFVINKTIIVGYNRKAILCALGKTKCLNLEFIDTRQYSITKDYL